MSDSCSLGGRHTPAHLTLEEHHVTPVAWQQFWQPPVPPFPGQDPEGRGLLWDARTVAVCPTHHRNIHAVIVTLMHAVRADGLIPPPLPEVSRYRLPETAIALLALKRFRDAGGDLSALVGAHEWGQA